MAYKFTVLSKIKPKKLHQIFKLRQAVFVVEQECAYLDCDDIDLQAVHVIGYHDSGQIESYCRIYLDDLDNTKVSIGRVLVAKSFRHMGKARQLMLASLDYIRTNYLDCLEIEISAQEYLIGFYQSIGFNSVGDVFLEDNIPHQIMKMRTLNDR